LEDVSVFLFPLFAFFFFFHPIFRWRVKPLPSLFSISIFSFFFFLRGDHSGTVGFCFPHLRFGSPMSATLPRRPTCVPLSLPHIASFVIFFLLFFSALAPAPHHPPPNGCGIFISERDDLCVFSSLNPQACQLFPSFLPSNPSNTFFCLASAPILTTFLISYLFLAGTYSGPGL